MTFTIYRHRTRMHARTCVQRNIAKHIIRGTWFFSVNTYSRQDLRKKEKENNKGRGKGVKDTRVIFAKMARESKVLTLFCVAGTTPLLFQPQRHNSPLDSATWPDHTLLENVQIFVTHRPRSRILTTSFL